MPNTFSLTFTLYAPVAQDYVNFWTSQITGTIGALAAAILSTDTTFTFLADPGVSLIGKSVLIENEVILVTAGTGTGPYTGTRGVSANAGNGSTAAAAHASGLSIAQLKFKTLHQMVVQSAIVPFTQQIIQQAGPNSNVLQPGTIGGSVT